MDNQGITTGASNDIEVATGIATNMVTKWGFSDALGTIKYGEDEGSPFLGRSVSNPAPIRSDTNFKINRLGSESYNRFVLQKRLKNC